MNDRDHRACLRDACAAYDMLNPVWRELKQSKDFRFGSLAVYSPSEVWSVGDATAAGLSAACLRLLRIGVR